MKKEFTGRCVILGILVLVLGCGIGSGIYKKCQIRDTYEHAIDLMAVGEYQEAKDTLKVIEDEYYLDTHDLRELCSAHLDYEEQDYSRAYWCMNDLQFSHLTPKQKEELQIDSFREEVNDAYDTWNEKESKRIEQELEAKKKQNEKKETSGSSNSYNSYYRKKTYHPTYTYDDPYDVYDYDDPEDFYYDNEDDFDGYEDAEDYWDDAWDE